MEEQGLGRRERGHTLIKTTGCRKLWRDMIASTMKGKEVDIFLLFFPFSLSTFKTFFLNYLIIQVLFNMQPTLTIADILGSNIYTT